MKDNNLWFSDMGYPFREVGEDLPSFYDPSTFAWVQPLEDILKSNVEKFKNLMLEKSQSYFNRSLVHNENEWKVYDFFFMGIQNSDHCHAFPKLLRELVRIEHMVSAGLSLLEPGAVIKAHHGDTNGIIRCHFAIEIPRGLPDCGLTVAGTTKAWISDEPLMFCDALEHSAFNHSDHPRIIFIVDIIRPEFSYLKGDIAKRVRKIIAKQMDSEVKDEVWKIQSQ